MHSRHPSAVAAAGLCVALLLGVGSACAPRNATSTTPGPTGDQPSESRFIWQDLVTDDLEASRRFYGDLLGWTFEETDRLDEPYLLARSGDRYVGGITHVERRAPDEPVAQWLSYLVVDDVDRAAEQAAREGGRILVSPVDLAQGRAAVIADPQGAAVGLATPHLGLPLDDPRTAPAGTFFWRDYLAHDVEGARTFYEAITRLDVDQEDRPDALIHYVLRGAQEVGGIVPLTRGDVDPNWLAYIRVDDPAELARRAVTLGGQVLLAPRADLRNGSLAIVADPQGAAVALQRFPF